MKQSQYFKKKTDHNPYHVKINGWICDPLINEKSFDEKYEYGCFVYP